MIIDMHCDTVSEIRHRRTGKGEECGLRENKLHIDARRLKENGYLLQCFALFVSLRGCGAIDGQGLLRPDNAWADLQKLYQIYQQEMARNTDLLQPVTDAGDLEQCRQTGKVGAMLTVEEGGVCGGRPERLEELYAMGVRMLTLTWNFPNELGHPNINALNRQLGYRTRSDGHGTGLCAADGGIGDAGRCIPSVRQGILGCGGDRNQALCGQSFQCPGGVSLCT